jgi:hypothetical protein
MLYVDQKVRVWLAKGRPNNEVRISFNETNPEPVTLALSFDEASNLVAELGRVIEEDRGTESKIIAAAAEIIASGYISTGGLVTREAVRYRLVGIMARHLMPPGRRPCQAVGPHHGDPCDGGRIQSPNAQFTQDCPACKGTGYERNHDE